MIYEQNNNNEYILYNSLNGSIIKLKDQYYIELFKKIIVLNEIDIEDNEFYKMLIDNKYLIDIDRNELLDIKTMYQEKIVCDETLHLMLIMTRIATLIAFIVDKHIMKTKNLMRKKLL